MTEPTKSWKKLTTGAAAATLIGMCNQLGIDVDATTRFWGVVVIMAVTIAAQAVSDAAKYWGKS